MNIQLVEPNRRQVLAMAGGSAAALLLAGTPGFAANKDMGGELRGHMRALAGKIFYTTRQPGRWKGKEGGHSPFIKVEMDGKDLLLRAVTRHPMSKAHNIVKHILLDSDLNFIKEQIFDIEFDLPQSRFEMQGYKGRLFVVSMCNLHDNWINYTDIA
jgi:superoxide reductase